MANLDVGGVTAELAIGFQEWKRGLDQSMSKLSQFASQVDPKFAQIAANAILEVNKKGWTNGLTGALRELNVFEGATHKLFQDIRNNITSRLEGLGKVAKTAFQGLTAGAAVGAGAFAVSAVRAAADAQKLQLRLETLARSAGHVGDAADVAKSKMAFLERLDKVASSDLPTLTEAGAALEAYRLPMEGFLPLVGDFSAAMGADLKEVSRAVGKAMQGQAEGFEILSNLGVTKQDLFAAGAHRNNDNTMALVGVDDQAAAQKALLTVLQRYQGGMEAESKGIDGAFSMIGSSWNKLQKAVAEPFSDAIQRAALAVSGFLDQSTAFVTWLQQSEGGITSWVASAGGMVAAFSGVAVAVVSSLAAIGVPMLAFLSTLGKIGLVARTFSFLFTAIAEWAPKLGFLGTIGTWLGGIASKAGMVQGAVIALGTALTTTLLAAFAVVATVAAAFALAWVRDWGGIREKTAEAVEWIRNAAVNGFTLLKIQAVAIWEATKVAVVRILERLEAEAKPAVDAVVAWFRENWPTIKSIAIQTMSAVLAVVAKTSQDLHSAFEWAGANLLPVWQFLWRNVKDQVVLAWKVISTTVSSVLKGIDTAMRVGMEVVKGNWQAAWGEIKLGLERQFDPINVAIRRLIVSILQTVQESIPKFNIAGQAIAAAISQGIQDQEGAISRLEARIAALNSRGVSISQGTGSFLTWLGQLGKPPAEGQPSTTPQPPQPPPFDFEKFLREQMSGLGQSSNNGSDEKNPQGKRSRKDLTTGEMLAYIRRHSNVRADLKGMQAIAVRATYKLVQNAVSEGIRLTLTSGRRYGSGGSFHNAGLGLDVVLPGYSDGSVQAGEALKRLAVGTGFKSGINEYLPAAREWTGGEGAHGHLAVGMEPGVKAGLVGAFAVPGPAGSTGEGAPARMEAAKKKLENLGNEVGKLLGEQIDRQISFLEEMSTQRIELMTSDTERERAELDKRFADMVAYWERVKTQTPGLAAQAEEQITLVRQAEVEQRAALDRAQWERQHEEALANQEWQVQMGRETHEDLTAFLAQQLEAWQGTEDGKRALMLKYREAFKADLDAMREAQAEFDEEDLARMVGVLQAKTDLTVAERIRLDELLAELDAAQTEKMLQWQGVAESVSQAFQSSFTSAFVGVLSGQQTFAQGMKTIWQSLVQTILAEIAKVIAKLLALRALQILTGFFFPVGAVGGGAGSGLGGSVGALVTGGGGGGFSPIATGLIPMFHDGGVVGLDAPRSDEVLALLQRGEVVLSRDTVGALGQPSATGGQSVNLTIENLHNHGPQDVATMARDLGRRTAWYLQGA